MIPLVGGSARAPGGRGASGYALLMSLVTLTVVIAAIALAVGLVHGEQARARDEAIDIRLEALADAAVAEVLATLAVDPSYPGAGLSFLGHGAFESRVERVGAGWRIYGRASIGAQRRLVRVEAISVGGVPRALTWQPVGAADPDSWVAARRTERSG